MVGVCLTLPETSKLFSKALSYFASPPVMCEHLFSFFTSPSLKRIRAKVPGSVVARNKASRSLLLLFWFALPGSGLCGSDLSVNSLCGSLETSRGEWRRERKRKRVSKGCVVSEVPSGQWSSVPSRAKCNTHPGSSCTCGAGDRGDRGVQTPSPTRPQGRAAASSQSSLALPACSVCRASWRWQPESQEGVSKLAKVRQNWAVTSC